MTSTRPKPFVFVLMPFSNEFDDVYHLGIKPACSDAGAYCERVDEQIFQESILERIYNQIGKADIVVADMTGRNPNVFYETGYAHALDKRVILLTQDGDDIPFDLKHYPHIIYAGKIVSLKAELEKRIRWYVDNPDQSPTRIEFDLEIFADGKPLTSHPEASCKWKWLSADQDYGLVVQFDIHNPNSSLYDSSASLGIIMPNIEQNSSGIKTIRLPDGRYQHLLGRIPSILPKGWESLSVILSYHPRKMYSTDGEINAVAVIYTELGAKEFSIKLKYPEKPTNY